MQLKISPEAKLTVTSSYTFNQNKAGHVATSTTKNKLQNKANQNTK